eukprot:TRINITY_DN21153_c0_g1_i1.p1 TRINITY_DN21153_c0_g1~~TRINITY_DN21153_c0_g1_i1.p1  ORF type:complete len:402 (+),score=113.32 TRINITY_DN21153_c0_g1_i1:102-1307(+)
MEQQLCPRVGAPPADTPAEVVLAGSTVPVRALCHEADAAVEYFVALYGELRGKADDEVFEHVSREKAAVDAKADALAAAAAQLQRVEARSRNGKAGSTDGDAPLPQVTVEYLRLLQRSAETARRYRNVLQTFLVVRLAGFMGESGGVAAGYGEMIVAMFEDRKGGREGGPPAGAAHHAPLEPNSQQLLPVQELKSLAEIEAAMASVCQALNAERARLWGQEGIAEDGTPQPSREGRWAGFARRWIEPLGCNTCVSARPQYPTSPLLEQLVAELAELRCAALRLPRPEPRLLRLAEATLLGLDPNNIRNGTDAVYYRDELAKLEENIADVAAGPVAVPAAVRAALSAFKRTLNTLHQLLLYRLQCLHDTPVAQDYHELVTLCESLLDEVFTAERRAAGNRAA